LEQSYTFSADIWSLGVISYLLIIGCLPFDHESDQQQIVRYIILNYFNYRMTLEEPPNLSDRRWKHNTPSARNFVKSIINFYLGILQKNPDDRMKIKEILDHEWFLEQDKNQFNQMRSKKEFDGKSDFEIYSSTNY
jgi:serine/threonine protein kinase